MTTKSKEQMYFNCLMIEAMVKTMVIKGTTNNHLNTNTDVIGKRDSGA